MAVVSCVASRVLLFNRQVSDSLTRVLHSFVCDDVDGVISHKLLVHIVFTYTTQSS